MLASPFGQSDDLLNALLDVGAKGGGVKDDIVSGDIALSRAKEEVKLLKAKYQEALRQIKSYQKEQEAQKSLSGKISTFAIKPKEPNGGSEAAAVILASDWHIEERVTLASTNGLNSFTIDLARNRAVKFWQTAVRMVEIYSRDIKINHIIVGLLGDYISNDIHDELSETAQLLPMEAIIEAEGLIASGIEFMLQNTTCDITLVCKSGNHARTTQKQRHSTEHGHSLEHFMFHHLSSQFKDPRLKFVIEDSYHTYLDILGMTVRFHHGHDIRYQGGVGGLTIPVNKAIAQWNKGKHADLDVFGHWHTRFDGGNFVCNGSMIGYNAYAISIKASFEKPTQQFFLIDRKRGKTVTAPICFE